MTYIMNMLPRIFLCLFLICFELLPITIFAAPNVKVWSTKTTVEKGDVFQIRVKIGTTEAISDVLVVPIPPAGFVVEPILQPGLEKVSSTASDGERVPAIRIKSLAPGSEILVSFKVFPPSVLGHKTKGEDDKQHVTYTTEEEKYIGVNVLYKTASGDDYTRAITQQIPIRFTTDMSIYLIFGLLGILIGHVVKTSTKGREQIESVLKSLSEGGFWTRLRLILKYIFVTRITALFTTLALGFGVLIILARESLPVNTWDQALAMGMGLALIADEQLLSKIK